MEQEQKINNVLDQHYRELLDTRKSIAKNAQSLGCSFNLNWDEYQPSSRIDLYDANGIWLGPIYNDTEFAWVRLQIIKQNVTGLSIKYKDKMYEILPDGAIKNCPADLGSKTYKYVVDILNERYEQKNLENR